MSESTKSLEQIQFLALVAVFFEVDRRWWSSSDCRNYLNKYSSFIGNFYKKFKIRNFSAEWSYTKNQQNCEHDLEQELLDHINQSGLKFELFRREPSLCLSHDIDYLRPTWQMKVKRLVHDKKWFHYPENFLKSLDHLLSIDLQYARAPRSVTAFVANVKKQHGHMKRLKQILMDPSYKITDSLFEELVILLKSKNIEFGIHGSIYSLDEEVFKDEYQALQEKVGEPISLVRQHWLRWPEGKQYQILKTPVKIDSTLGWNNAVGFRGGFSRPYPIFFSNQEYLWEVPLTVMDGALYGSLGLNDKEAIKVVIKHLELVKQTGGCVSMDWHERSADKSYGWEHSYEKILCWADENGFKFKGFTSEFTDDRILAGIVGKP